MDALITMLRNVILFVALALPGFLLVKSGNLKQEQSGVLSKLMLYVGMPFLIFSSTIAIEFNREQLLAIGITALIGIVFTLVMFFVSTPLTAMEKNTKTRGMMQFCAVFANNGFLGIPLAEAVFPGNKQLLMVVIIINIITTVGKIVGMFICIILCIRVAPSIMADSCKDGSTPASAATYIIQLQPKLCQTPDHTYICGKTVLLDIKSNAVPPSDVITLLINPFVGEKKRFNILTNTTVEIKCGAYVIV